MDTITQQETRGTRTVLGLSVSIQLYIYIYIHTHYPVAGYKIIYSVATLSYDNYYINL